MKLKSQRVRLVHGAIPSPYALEIAAFLHTDRKFETHFFIENFMKFRAGCSVIGGAEF